jgi:hypothetical protein
VNGLSRSGCPRLVVRHVTKINFPFHHYKNAEEEKKTSWFIKCGHRRKENSEAPKRGKRDVCHNKVDKVVSVG